MTLNNGMSAVKTFTLREMVTHSFWLSQLQHQDKLRPQLGHPQKVNDLEVGEID